MQNLNEGQRHESDIIMIAVERNGGGIFFLNDPGGTKNTYLYHAILAFLKIIAHSISRYYNKNCKMLLHGGRTSHLEFKLPLNLDASSICSINKQSIW